MQVKKPEDDPENTEEDVFVSLESEGCEIEPLSEVEEADQAFIGGSDFEVPPSEAEEVDQASGQSEGNGDEVERAEVGAARVEPANPPLLANHVPKCTTWTDSEVCLAK